MIIDGFSTSIAMAHRAINNELGDVFCKDIDGIQICNIVNGFLGYPYCEASERFARYIEKCNAIIQTNNQKKHSHKKAAVILQASSDNLEAYNNCTFLPQLEELSKTHYVVLRLIGRRGETLRESISEAAKKIGDRSFMTLVVRAHGNERAMLLGHENIYHINNVSAEDFAPLDKRASIILDSCKTYDLAKKIAIIQPRSVFACINKFRESFLTHCCDKHGYGIVSFDESYNQLSRRFTHRNDFAKEAVPCCASDDGIEKIKKILLCNTMTASANGDAVAQFNLGCLYDEGVMVPQSDERAAFYYLQAAKKGHVAAQFNLGVCYFLGRGVPQSDGDWAEWNQNAAERGQALAQFNLSIAYMDGKGVPQSDEKALFWTFQAAKQGNPIAQYNLGNAYYYGNAIAQNYEKAVFWYLKSASQGNYEAQHNLGICCKEGYGVIQSFSKAVEQFLNAANQGYALSQCSLGICFAEGLGVPQTYVEAEKWLQKAAEQGNELAKLRLDDFLT